MDSILWFSEAAGGFLRLKGASSTLQSLGFWNHAHLTNAAVQVDPRRFVGPESVAEAVEYLQSGASSGKVVVQIARELPAAAAGGGSRL